MYSMACRLVPLREVAIQFHKHLFNTFHRPNIMLSTMRENRSILSPVSKGLTVFQGMRLAR